MNDEELRWVFWARKILGDLAFAAPELHEEKVSLRIAQAMTEAVEENRKARKAARQRLRILAAEAGASESEKRAAHVTALKRMAFREGDPEAMPTVEGTLPWARFHRTFEGPLTGTVLREVSRLEGKRVRITIEELSGEEEVGPE